jgi:hypothetical protein
MRDAAKKVLVSHRVTLVQLRCNKGEAERRKKTLYGQLEESKGVESPLFFEEPEEAERLTIDTSSLSEEFALNKALALWQYEATGVYGHGGCVYRYCPNADICKEHPAGCMLRVKN